MSQLLASIVPASPVAVESLDIVLDGKTLGQVRRLADISTTSWMACFKPSSDVTDSCLIQGFGTTPDGAIADAISRSTEKYKRHLERIKRLRTRLYAEDASDEDA